jgi:hypothetical protein
MVGFFVGMILTGILLSALYGSLILEAEEKAYQKGYEDGKRRVQMETTR